MTSSDPFEGLHTHLPYPLINDQAEHFYRICGILQKSMVAGDCSVAGSGKTFTTSAIGHVFGLPILVIAPKSCCSVWTGMRKYGIQVLEPITYESLRSTRGNQPKHGLLIRSDLQRVDKNGKVRIYTSFEATDKFMDLARSGILLVFDEVQKVKNTSDQFRAAAALTLGLNTANSRSRMMILSGTPFDKEEHAINLMRLIGFIRHEKLYNKSRSGDITLLGVQEALDVANHYAPAKTQALLYAKPPVTKTVIHSYPFELFLILKDHIISCMGIPKTVDKDLKNGFYRVSPQDFEITNGIAEGVNMLGKVVGYQHDSAGESSIDIKNIDWGALTLALMQIERSKREIFLRQTLEKIRDHKVLIFLNYLENIEWLRDELLRRGIQPVVMTGSSSIPQRQEVVRRFQEENWNTQVFIGITTVVGMGISLDDQSSHGEFKRFLMISPNYKILILHQAASRVYRQKTTSEPVIRYVYGGDEFGSLEVKILDNLAKKSEVMKKVLTKQVEDGVQFPGSLNYVEIRV